MAPKRRFQFDPKIFLSVIGTGRAMVSFQKKQTIYAQGDPCDAVFYVQNAYSCESDQASCLKAIANLANPIRAIGA